MKYNYFNKFIFLLLFFYYVASLSGVLLCFSVEDIFIKNI